MIRWYSDTFRAVALAATLGTSALGAHAALLDAPVPASAYITKSGLDWAWANPVEGADLSYQGGQGWRLPTAQELAYAPNATDFLKADGNVPFGGADPVSGAQFLSTNAAYTGPGACAAPYFSTTYVHCDWQDGNGQAGGPWFGTLPGPTGNEQLVVRGTLAVTPQAIPTLDTVGLALLSLGLVVAGGIATRRRTTR